jgi:hypothetical protein
VVASIQSYQFSTAFSATAPTLRTETTPLRYFEALNAGDFGATAALFAIDGALHPPFEDPVVGREAIAAYLQQEAQGLQLYPQREEMRHYVEGNLLQLRVVGRVQTPLFGVNVAWKFVLNPQQEIVYVAVELLASLQELLKYRR